MEPHGSGGRYAVDDVNAGPVNAVDAVQRD